MLSPLAAVKLKKLQGLKTPVPWRTPRPLTLAPLALIQRQAVEWLVTRLPKAAWVPRARRLKTRLEWTPALAVPQVLAAQVLVAWTPARVMLAVQALAELAPVVQVQVVPVARVLVALGPAGQDLVGQAAASPACKRQRI